MGSPITFSGFNNIDFSSILNAIMTQESQPVRTLQSQQQAMQLQKSAFSTLASKLSTLESTIKTLGKRTEFGGKTAASTNANAVAVSASSAASVGSYDVVVSDLARSQTTASGPVGDKDTTTIATGGTMVINGVPVTVTVPTTLQGLADAINANDDVNVTAAVVSTAPGSYELVLTGKSTGSAGAFTVQNNLTGGSGLTFTDTDGDGLSGNSAADNAQSAANAAFTVNNIPVSSSTNTVEDVIPGVSLQLLKKDPTTPVTISVTQDQQAAKDQVQAFVTAFNDIMKFADDQGKSAGQGDASSIGHDALLRGLRNDLRTAINHEYPSAGKYTYLSQIGIGFQRDGKMKFDEAAFDEATKNGTGDVLKLFVGGTGPAAGAFTALETLVKTYTDAGGLLPNAEDRLDKSLSSLGNRIDAMNARLAIRRDALSKEFTATDSAISALNNSINSLSSLNNQYRLF
jgi:flagellar hook-associated protein 2